MEDLLADPADTREEILGAAFRALCEHGYAALTIKRIGESFEKSPSLVYHHYEGKDELLVDLLEFTLGRFEELLSRDEFALPPRERLATYVAVSLDPESVDYPRAPSAEFMRVVVELRAQATHDEDYRDHFDRSDRVFEAFLVETVREAARELAGDEREHGAASGEAGVSPVEVAATLQTAAEGGTFRWATTSDRDWVDAVRRGVDRYLDATLPAVDPDLD